MSSALSQKNVTCISKGQKRALFQSKRFTRNFSEITALINMKPGFTRNPTISLKLSSTFKNITTGRFVQSGTEPARLKIAKQNFN
jgi:hypothetical protein